MVFWRGDAVLQGNPSGSAPHTIILVPLAFKNHPPHLAHPTQPILITTLTILTPLYNHCLYPALPSTHIRIHSETNDPCLVKLDQCIRRSCRKSIKGYSLCLNNFLHPGWGSDKCVHLLTPHSCSVSRLTGLSLSLVLKAKTITSHYDDHIIML